MTDPAPDPGLDPDLLARCGRCRREVEVHDGLPGVWGPLSKDASGSPTCRDGHPHLPDRVPPRQRREGVQVTTAADRGLLDAVDVAGTAGEAVSTGGGDSAPSGGSGGGPSGGRGGGPTPGTGSTGSGSEAIAGGGSSGGCSDCCGGDCSPCLLTPGLVLLLWTGLVGLLAPRRALRRHGEQPAGASLRGRLLAAVRLYQLRVSAARPARCRYAPTCSAYATQALQRHGVVRGLALTARRLLRCRPGTSGGSDPV